MLLSRPLCSPQRTMLTISSAMDETGSDLMWRERCVCAELRDVIQFATSTTESAYRDAFGAHHLGEQRKPTPQTLHHEVAENITALPRPG